MDHRAGSIDALHGIRFISMAWVILGHTYYFLVLYLCQFWIGNAISNSKSAANPARAMELPKEFLFMIVNNATVAVDSFFVLSAFLLSYLFLQHAAATKNRQMNKVGYWIYYYVHRYIR